MCFEVDLPVSYPIIHLFVSLPWHPDAMLDEIRHLCGGTLSPYAYVATSCAAWPLLVAERVPVPSGFPFVMDAFSNDLVSFDLLRAMVDMLPTPLPRSAVDTNRVCRAFMVAVMRGPRFALLFASTFRVTETDLPTSAALTEAVRRGPGAVRNLSCAFPDVRADQSVVDAVAKALSVEVLEALPFSVCVDNGFWVALCAAASRQPHEAKDIALGSDADAAAGFACVMRRIKHLRASFVCEILVTLHQAGKVPWMQRAIEVVCERNLVVDLMVELMSLEAIPDSSVFALARLVSTEGDLQRAVCACADHMRDQLAKSIIEFVRKERGVPAFMDSPTSAHALLSRVLEAEERWRRRRQSAPALADPLQQGVDIWSKVASFISIVSRMCPDFGRTHQYAALLAARLVALSDAN